MPIQNQGDSWLPEELADIKIHAEQVAKTQSGWKKENHQPISEIRKLALSPEVGSPEGAGKMEESLKNLGMPGIRDSGVAVDQLDKREEAMFEERNLREQGETYLNLNFQDKERATARIYNGNGYRKDWFGVRDYARSNGQKFEIAPVSPIGKEIQRQLKIMVDNEIRLAAARNPKLGLDYKDNSKVSNLSDKIITDPEFISTLNQEGIMPNTTRIKFEIERRIKK